jgi:hypothetical protein
MRAGVAPETRQGILTMLLRWEDSLRQHRRHQQRWGPSISKLLRFAKQFLAQDDRANSRPIVRDGPRSSQSGRHEKAADSRLTL